jgi:hypothetical protein
MAHVNDRLAKSIEAYCHAMDDGGIDDLARTVSSGSAAWFPDAFGEGLRAGRFTPREWERLTNVAMDDDDEEELDRYLRLVWSKVAPDRPYPLDA